MSIRVTTFLGEEVYDGPGRIIMGALARGFGFRGVNPVVVETADADGERSRTDLTVLLNHVHYDWVADYQDMGSMAPEWTLRIDLGPEQAAVLREALGVIELEREAERVIQAAICLERRRQHRGNPSGPESITLYDDLINSTRAEFLPDPHAYTTPRTNAMSWSPPAEGEKVARCP